MKFHNVTLIGGGVLGSQTAYQSAYKEFDIIVYLRSEASVERAKPKVERLGAFTSPISRQLRPASAHPPLILEV